MPKRRICYKCGQPGHIKRDCSPLLRAAAAGGGQAAAAPVPSAGHQPAAGAAADPATTSGRQELRGLRLGELKRRARAVGVTDQRLEEADDTESPTETVTDLLLAATDGAAGRRGAGPAPPGAGRASSSSRKKVAASTVGAAGGTGNTGSTLPPAPAASAAKAAGERATGTPDASRSSRKLCRLFSVQSGCKYGDRCKFVHGEAVAVGRRTQAAENSDCTPNASAPSSSNTRTPLLAHRSITSAAAKRATILASSAAKPSRANPARQHRDIDATMALNARLAAAEKTPVAVDAGNSDDGEDDEDDADDSDSESGESDSDDSDDSSEYYRRMSKVWK